MGIDIPVKDEEEFSEQTGKPNYIGKVTDVTETDEHPVSGKPLTSKYGGVDKLLVLMVEPEYAIDEEGNKQEVDWDDLSIIMNPKTRRRDSKFYHFNKACKKLGIENIGNMLRKRFEFKDIEVETPSETKRIDVPVREVKRPEAEEI